MNNLRKLTWELCDIIFEEDSPNVSWIFGSCPIRMYEIKLVNEKPVGWAYFDIAEHDHNPLYETSPLVPCTDLEECKAQAQEHWEDMVRALYFEAEEVV